MKLCDRPTAKILIMKMFRLDEKLTPLNLKVRRKITVNILICKT